MVSQKVLDRKSEKNSKMPKKIVMKKIAKTIRSIRQIIWLENCQKLPETFQSVGTPSISKNII